MTLRDILGLYGPNKPKWSEEAYQAIIDSRVSWVVWRLDADPEAPQILASKGINVICQDIDGWSADPFAAPALEAAQAFNEVCERCPPGTPFVFENEPNLDPKRAGIWHAEQWARFARAYMAQWRWLDPAGQFPLILPALAVGPDRNGRLWHRTNWENLRECDGIGLHAYWQQPDQVMQPDFGQPWALLDHAFSARESYVLEYANTHPGLTHADTRDQYNLFLHSLPLTVKCACLFGVDLTDEWSRFSVSRDVIEWLARLK